MGFSSETKARRRYKAGQLEGEDFPVETLVWAYLTGNFADGSGSPGQQGHDADAYYGQDWFSGALEVHLRGHRS